MNGPPFPTLDPGEQFGGASVRVPILVGPLHTVEGDDLPPLHAGDPRFATGIRIVEFPLPLRACPPRELGQR